MDDKTSKVIVESTMVSLTAWMVSIIRSTLATSDFEIISPITSTLLFSLLETFNIWVNIFSLISLFSSRSDPVDIWLVKNILSRLTRLVTTVEIKSSSSLSRIISIDSPILSGSEIFKTFDKNSAFSEDELPTRKFIFSCFSSLILSI